MNNGINLENLKEQIMNPQDVSDMFTAEDIEQNKALAILAIFPFLFWIPIAFKSDSGFGKFYANQGLLLTVLTLAINIVAGILIFILGLVPFIGGLLAGIVGLAANLLMIGAWLFLLINSAKGKATVLPVVGNLFTAFQ